MEEEDVEEAVTVVRSIAFALSLVQLLVLSRQAGRRLQWQWPPTPEVWSTPEKAWSAGTGAQAKLNELRVASARRSFALLSASIAGLEIVNLFFATQTGHVSASSPTMAAEGSETDVGSSPPSSASLTPVLILHTLACVGLLGCLVVSLSPKLVNTRTLSSWYSGAMLCLMAAVSPLAAGSVETLLIGATLSMAATLSLSMASPRERLATSWNVAHAVACVASFLYISSEEALEDGRTTLFALGVFGACAQKLLLLYDMQWVMAASAKQEIAAREEKCVASARSALLDSVCDAVVELDCDMHIVDHVPSLGSMLVEGVGTSLEGVKLTDFIPEEEERAGFERRLVEAREAVRNGVCSQQAAVFNIGVCDAYGMIVGAQVFLVAYRTFEQEFRHLIGIKKDPRGAPASSPFSPGRSPALAPALSPVMLPSTSPSLSPPPSLPPSQLTLSAPACGGAAPLAVELIQAQLEVMRAYMEPLRPFLDAMASPPSSLALTEVAVPSSRSSTSSGGGRDFSLQVDIYARSGLPITFASARFNEKFGLAAMGEAFADRLEEGAAFEAWILARTSELRQGIRMPGVQTFGYAVVLPSTAATPAAATAAASATSSDGNSPQEEEKKEGVDGARGDGGAPKGTDGTVAGGEAAGSKNSTMTPTTTMASTASAKGKRAAERRLISVNFPEPSPFGDALSSNDYRVSIRLGHRKATQSGGTAPQAFAEVL